MFGAISRRSSPDYSPDGNWIASGSWDSTVRLWDAATGALCATLPHTSGVHSLAYTPDGRLLVSATISDDRLYVWDTATARLVKKLDRAPGSYPSLAISADGRRLAVSGAMQHDHTHRLHIYDLASGERLRATTGGGPAYSPDGHWLAVVDGNSVRLLDAQSNEVVKSFSGHEAGIVKLVFSPNSRFVASASADDTVRVWDVASGACRVLRGHTDDVFAVAFHPDGRRLATGGRDRAVWLWDLDHGQEVARLPGHSSHVWSLAFSRDGSTMASGSGDTTVMLWDTQPLKTRYQARLKIESVRPEADRLVARLFAELREPAQVAARIREDGTLDPALRRAALQAVMRHENQTLGTARQP